MSDGQQDTPMITISLETTDMCLLLATSTDQSDSSILILRHSALSPQTGKAVVCHFTMSTGGPFTGAFDGHMGFSPIF